MQIKGHIVNAYPEVSNNYLGQPYRYKDIIVMAEEPLPGSTFRERIAIRVKNAHLDSLKQLDCEKGGIFIFTFMAVCEERKRPDNTVYPVNRSMVLLTVEPIPS